MIAAIMCPVPSGQITKDTQGHLQLQLHLQVVTVITVDTTRWLPTTADSVFMWAAPQCVNLSLAYQGKPNRGEANPGKHLYLL